MTLADLLHGPRYAVMARFGWEAQAAPLPGRLYTLERAERRIAWMRRQPEFREARELRPVLLPPSAVPRAAHHRRRCGVNAYLNTGIRNLAAAKKYLRDRWRQDPLPEIVIRPGARFYVTARNGRQTQYLLGPYVSHMTALAAVPRAKARVHHGLATTVGTASRPDTVRTRFGR